MRTRPSIVVPALVSILIAASCASDTRGSMPEGDLAVWRAAQSRNGAGPLDGREFAIEIGERDRPATQRETVEFAGGRFHSRACDEYGFGTGEYTSRAVDGGIEFHAVCTSATSGRNEWHGTVRADSIQGGFTWTPLSGAPVEHWFQSAH